MTRLHISRLAERMATLLPSVKELKLFIEIINLISFYKIYSSVSFLLFQYMPNKWMDNWSICIYLWSFQMWSSSSRTMLSNRALEHASQLWLLQSHLNIFFCYVENNTYLAGSSWDWLPMEGFASSKYSTSHYCI